MGRDEESTRSKVIDMTTSPLEAAVFFEGVEIFPRPQQTKALLQDLQALRKSSPNTRWLNATTPLFALPEQTLPFAKLVADASLQQVEFRVLYFQGGSVAQFDSTPREANMEASG